MNDNNTQEMALTTDEPASLPAIPETNLDFYHAVRVPLSQLPALGTAFASLPEALRTVSTTTSVAVEGEGLCRLVDASGSPIPLEALMEFKDGSGRLGSYRKGRSFAQARHVSVGDLTGTKVTEVVQPYDPTMMFLAVALMQVNQKLDSIKDMQKRMFTYAKERDRAKLLAGFRVLDEVRRNYRFNSDNRMWLSARHALVAGAWKDAEAAIELHRRRLGGMLDALGPVHVGADVDKKTAEMTEALRDYQLASYLFAYATVADVVLTGNFGREYLESVAGRLERYSGDYLTLYNRCADAIERDARGTLSSRALSGLGAVGRRASELVAATPVGDATRIDEALADGSKALHSLAKVGVKRSVRELAQAKPGFMRPFIDSIEEMDRLHNEPVALAVGTDAVYLLQA